jgi:antitoxin component YwqK of YwqJK toxin-antitoxin module
VKIISIILSSFVLLSCGNTKNAIPPKTGVNHQWLDSVKQSADTIYEKRYGTLKFAKAVYYNNSGTNTICQVMKDSSDSIRQIILTKNGKRSFFAEYYSNGQIIAALPLDGFGQYNGASKYYYENGFIETEGEYQAGLKKGSWKNYDQKGRLISTSKYDGNGQAIETVPAK